LSNLFDIVAVLLDVNKTSSECLLNVMMWSRGSHLLHQLFL